MTEPRQYRERSGHRLAELVRAQQQLARQLAHATVGDGLARAVADAAMLVFPCHVAELYRFRGERIDRVVRVGTPLDPADADTLDLELVRAVGDSGVAHMATRLTPHPDAPAGTTELCAPVRDMRHGAGVLRLVASPGHAFDGEDLFLVAVLTGHAATAAEAARLVTAQRRQRRRAELSAALGRVAIHATQLVPGAQQLLDVLARALPVRGLALGVSRARDGHLEYIAANGALEYYVGVEQPPETSDPLRVLSLASRGHQIGELRVLASDTSLRTLKRLGRALEYVATPLTLSLDAMLLDEEERFAREREHLLATGLTTINHPIFILDQSGIRYANPATAREYGWTQPELMEMKFEDLVVGADTREGLDAGSGIVEAGVRISHDIHRRKNGAEFPAAVSIAPLRGHTGDILGQVVSVRDVSQDRHVEEQLRHTEKMVALGELVAGVAHEINNPLTGISAFAQILLEEELGEEQRESVQLIKQESDRAKGVIRDLLLFARKTDRGFGPVDVNAMLQQVVRLRTYPLRQAGVKVTLELDPNAPKVSGDEQKLQQVLLNMISNAEFAMQGRLERVLTLSTRTSGDQVHILAHDTGRGMSAEVKRRIFEPFFSTKPAGLGTGLGLSVSYGIVHAHGGSISVESEPDVGTTFQLNLPVLASTPAFVESPS
ncbi:MAG: PAS domain S-box protein [Gemmatimonadaceae bacterium]|nr:PAS domain S-box protein [Gemmatimonadaceae bacterium]